MFAITAQPFGILVQAVTASAGDVSSRPISSLPARWSLASSASPAPRCTRRSLRGIPGSSGHSLPARQLAGPLSRVDAPHLASSVLGLSDIISRQLNSPLAHSLVPTTSHRHSSPCVLGLQRDGRHYSPVCLLTGSLAHRRALLFARHARHASLLVWCGHQTTSLCVVSTTHTLKPRPLVSNHMPMLMHRFSHTPPEPSPSLWGELC
jgi:hypothetical protein